MKITKEELEKKYRRMKNKELAKELKISEPTLISLLKKAGIKIKKAEKKVEII